MSLRIQVIRCNCGKIYAAHWEPHCYTSKSWQNDIKRAEKLGRKVELLEPKTWTFESCTCEGEQLEIPDPNQLQLLL